MNVNRLTKPYEIHNNEVISYVADASKYHDLRGYEQQQADIDAINKLGQLEDIEEELGVDLITLFKALKEGIWVHTIWGKHEFIKEIPVFEYKDNNYLFSLNFETIKKIKDYKTTWWLKEDLQDE